MQTISISVDNINSCYTFTIIENEYKSWSFYFNDIHFVEMVL